MQSQVIVYLQNDQLNSPDGKALLDDLKAKHTKVVTRNPQFFGRGDVEKFGSFYPDLVVVQKGFDNVVDAYANVKDQNDRPVKVKIEVVEIEVPVPEGVEEPSVQLPPEKPKAKGDSKKIK